MDQIIVIALVAVVLLAIIFVKKSIVIISQSETKIIERLGKYYATLNPGINVIIPFIDQPKPIVALIRGRYVYTHTIDLREQVYDFPSQQVITKDNVTTEINALLYFQIVDAKKAVYEIDNQGRPYNYEENAARFNQQFGSQAVMQNLIGIMMEKEKVENNTLKFYTE